MGGPDRAVTRVLAETHRAAIRSRGRRKSFRYVHTGGKTHRGRGAGEYQRPIKATLRRVLHLARRVRLGAQDGYGPAMRGKGTGMPARGATLEL